MDGRDERGCLLIRLAWVVGKSTRNRVADKADTPGGGLACLLLCMRYFVIVGICGDMRVVRKALTKSMQGIKIYA